MIFSSQDIQFVSSLPLGKSEFSREGVIVADLSELPNSIRFVDIFAMIDVNDEDRHD
jgi:hypothetical protein